MGTTAYIDESPIDPPCVPGEVVEDARRSITFRVPDFTVVIGPKLALAHTFRLRYRGEYYTVPEGFATDGASIPRPLWWLCGSPFDVPRLYAAIVHDWLYSGGDREATRADADDLYRDLQIALGVARWKAYAEWAALRVFGGAHWYGNAVIDSATDAPKITDPANAAPSRNDFCNSTPTCKDSLQAGNQQKENKQ